MPKFLAHQVLPEGGDPLRDHLEPGARTLATQLANPDSVDVRWVWGCADLERDEWYMLFDAPDEAAMREFLAPYPGIDSVRRVLYVHPDNLSWALISGIADTRDRREAAADVRGGDGAATTPTPEHDNGQRSSG